MRGETYMGMSHVRAAIEAFARSSLTAAGSAHDVYHIERVWRLATWITHAEGLRIDWDTLHAAVWLHDSADPKIQARTLEAIRDFLTQYYPPEKVTRILTSMEGISYRDRLRGLKPRTSEGWILHDADKLDAMGAIGIARAFAYGGQQGRPLYTPGERPRRGRYPSRENSLLHLHEKLLQLPRLIHYPTARKLAEERARFIRHFAAEFLREWYSTDLPGEYVDAKD